MISVRQLAATLLVPLSLRFFSSDTEAFGSGTSIPVPANTDHKSSIILDTRRDCFQSALWGVLSAFAFSPTSAAAAAEEVLYDTAKDIPDSVIDSHTILRGYVERVIDGDTLRVRHLGARTGTPANGTIAIRLYGIDAPETAKTSSEISQPFAQEAQQWTRGLSYHKLVDVQLLKRDQYHRIIAKVDVLSSPQPTDLSLELAANGLATLYDGHGAEYDGRRDLLKEAIAEARRSNLGIWSLGDEFVTPAEYKRQKREKRAPPPP